MDLKHSIIHIRKVLFIGENDKPVRKDTNKNLTSRHNAPIIVTRLQEFSEQTIEMATNLKNQCQ